jgi:Ni/Fe-hydrogenase b-type cytochrome subunit
VPALVLMTQLNVWFDVVFTALYACLVAGLVLHFLGNVITGRAKRRFIRGEWPAHEGGPIPATPKILHFQHVTAMIVLVISGMYIRFPGLIPFLKGPYARWGMRWVHYVAMTVVIVNLIVRLWYAFASKRRDYREFAITRRDITTAPKVIAYYLFLIPPEKKPHLGKYNVMQKTTYMTFVPLLILQALTGLALLTYTIPFTEGIAAFGHAGVTPRDLMVGWWLGGIVGSTDLAGWYARTAHYVISWLFIILTTVHVYLALSEDFPAFQDFFGLTGAEHHTGTPHDLEHGHEDPPSLEGPEHA